jgi:hypothetical protein
MRFRRRLGVGPSRATTAALAAVAAATLIAACTSSTSSRPGSGATSTGSASTTAETTIGVDLTYNSTAFWAAYINYENQYAQQLHIHVLGPLLAGANASLQNTRIENLVGAASGVVLLGVVQNILDLENAPNYWIDAINGAVILVALILARVIGGEAAAE